MKRRLFGQSLLLPLLVMVLACETTAPSEDPTVKNVTDNFQFDVKNLENFTRNLEYEWSNTGTAAEVTVTTSITAGSARLVLLDADGTQVFSRSLTTGGTFTSEAGVAGTWEVRVIFGDADGAVSFEVSKSP